MNIIQYTNCNITNNQTKVPYGQVTGYASTNVPAYSNGNDSYISDEDHFLYGIYMGMRWQCVEYARRWLFIRTGSIFDSIDGAADMWTQLDHVQTVLDKKNFTFMKYSNGYFKRPQNESLLIYNRSGEDMPYGHVAVIVDVFNNSIRVAEQNYDSYHWLTRNYSREILYEIRNGNYYLLDNYPILGWMGINDQNQMKPLDQTTINAILLLNNSSSPSPSPSSSSPSSSSTSTSSSSSSSSSSSFSFIYLFNIIFLFNFN